jgi:hypothetical protein
VTPLGRRVATFVAACVAIDLYGYAIYHAWRTHLIGPGMTLVLLTVVAVLGVAGLALAPAWIRRARGEEAAPAPVEQRTPRPLWLNVVLVLAALAGGAGLALGDRIVWPQQAPASATEWIVLTAVNIAFAGLVIFTFLRIRRPTRIGIALAVILTIQSALQLVPGDSLARIASARFLFALVQMGVFYVPFGLWGGHLWRRIMTAIFTPPRR